MHPNRSFRKPDAARNIAFARSRAFGTLAVSADNGSQPGPLVSHIPFLLSDDGSSIELHLVRSNPIVRALQDDLPAVIAVTGGDAYVSPDWYEVEDQVPTWNYVAVHLRGTLMRLADDQLHGILQRLSAHQEEQLRPKRPWTSDKMDQTVYTKMQRQIVPIRMAVSDIQGTWKLSQNKPDDVRLRAANGVEQARLGLATETIHPLMRDPDGD
ncbi:MAG: FMN-binding negative transcriptional regulator [Rhizobiales bacterium]|nr:FMN-binding negative transcriptional regulator [Hyphomicrobiales bacterium]MBO6699399.1 FMN-binding negative transcriptional regulator [Hyphomicrobiales bacterium]MBO6736937.1 FMN-binding negative transcriptional regulator [Hyphomicrobiales bacterium]MBO6911989.1 FMN-binding negative transcriptional regulator [Hyphomicrobiales bacterium]MBO6954643.1 FMN-binding negative transcriptional regulator [Hyphomicrobiales bacterium]